MKSMAIFLEDPANPSKPFTKKSNTRLIWRLLLPAALGFVGVLLVPTLSFATVFAPGFAGPVLDAGLVQGGSSGTSLSVGGGSLVLRQAAGEGDGQISVMLNSPVDGDFLASVTASGPNLGRADLGLLVGTADWTYTLSDIFLNGTSGTVNANIFQPFVGAFQSSAVTTMTFTISRVGNTITNWYDLGAGPVVLNSGTDPALSGPVNIGVFLLEAVGDLDAHEGTFSNLSVQSIPEPATIGIMAWSLLVVGGMHRVRRIRALLQGPPPG